MTENYKQAGVDIEKGDLFVKRISQIVGSTHTAQVKEGIGGFGALYDQGDRYLVSGTDGVGTKIKIAQRLGIHQTVGIDLVAMCVNDIICSGAKPMFFLDYMAVGGLDLNISEDLIKGIVEGCKQASCALIGGETAEMPDIYKQGEYDLAGFAVGEVAKSDLIDGSNIEEGDSIIGIASSGFHSNGYSLLRKWIGNDRGLAKKLLTPTKIYVSVMRELQKQVQVKGIAHITGGGIDNINRINPKFHYMIDSFPTLDEVPPIFSEIFSRFPMSRQESLKTFNMGIGMVLIIKKVDEKKVLEIIEDQNEKGHIIGEVKTKNFQ